jgi:class 3 adenylate cyclase/tetratricopeptide (TPR) repeat protein
VHAEHASRLARTWLALDEPPPWRELQGSAVLADLSGFTRLTETLAVMGAEGVEVLHRALSLCFGTLLDTAMSLGGDVVGFAGDAALVWFDGDGHEQRAAVAATAMPANLGQLPAAVTGGRRLRVSVGAHTGTVLGVLTGGPQRSVVLCGPEISSLVRLQDAAEPGQVLMSDALAAHLPASWSGPRTGPGVVLKRRSAPAVRLDEAGMDVTEIATERWWSLVHPAVRHVLVAGVASEHRAASVGFVSVPGIDDVLAASGPDAVAELLGRAATTVTRVTTEVGITWIDVDVGAGSVKFLLAAGAPVAVPDDEGRMLVALRRILDESGVVMRAGAQRGPVFAGTLGVEGRRSYTVLGDAVNTAARALGQAKNGELVVAGGLGADARPTVTVVSLGSIAVKNKAKPVPLWRVDRVTAASPESAATVGTDVPPIVALRSVERERIAQAWEGAARGEGSAVALVGEPGMGAAELLNDLVDRAARGGARTTVVVADPYRRLIPYATVEAIIRSLAAGAGASEDPWPWLATFADRLGTDERAWLDDGRRALEHGEVPEGADVLGAGWRAQAVLAALLAEAVPGPWLPAVDGLDDVDDASTAVLRRLAAIAPKRPWLLVTSAGQDAAPLEAGTGLTVTLGPLPEDAATELVLDVNAGLRPDEVRRIVTAAKGNPFVLVELARHPHEGDLPESLDRLAHARLDGLPVEVRTAVREASVFGRVIDPAEVAAVVGRPDLASPDAWNRASTVLEPVGDGRLAFRHDAYRLTAYRSLTYQRRRELHGAIAEHLAAGDDPEDAVLARHYEDAGRVREAFPFARRAATTAAAAGALVEAAEMLGRAVRMAQDVDRQALAPLVLQYLDVLYDVGDFAGVERVAAMGTRLLADPLDHAAICNTRASLAVRRGQYRTARSWVRKGLALVSAVRSDAAVRLRVRLLLADAAVHHYQGRNEACITVANEALQASRAAGSPLLEALCHQHLEMAHSALHHPEAMEHAEAGIALFDQHGDERNLLPTLTNAGITAFLQGRWDDARRYDERAADLARRSGRFYDAAIAEVNLGFLLLEQGRLAEADVLAGRSLRTFQALGLAVSTSFAVHQRARVAAEQGRFSEAADLMAAARAAFIDLDDRAMATECDIASLRALLLEGRPDDAVALAGRIVKDVERVEPAAQITYGRLRGVATAQAGRPDEGAALVAAALERARTAPVLHEVHHCLDALLEIQARGGPAAPDDAGAERAALAHHLGVVGAADRTGGEGGI